MRVPPNTDRPEPEPSWRWRRASATMAYVDVTYRLAPRPVKLIAWAVAMAAARRLGLTWSFLGSLG
jgi:hypothetical protein